MCAGVSGVVDEHGAVAQTCVDVVTVVQTPAAAPHGFTCVIGLNHRVGQQTATHTHTHTIYRMINSSHAYKNFTGEEITSNKNI